jgi:hypothetical protein
MLKLFQNNRVLRILRPTATVVGLFAALWHASHALYAWEQSHDLRATEPVVADRFWGAFQTELGVTLAAFFAGIFAWHLFKQRPESQP